jgi:hypothetical protein
VLLQALALSGQGGDIGILIILEDYQRWPKQSTCWGCGAVLKLFVAVSSTPVELGNQVIMSVLGVVCGWCLLTVGVMCCSFANRHLC